MSIFHLKLLSKNTCFYVISKNSSKLKIQPLVLGFLNLVTFAQNGVAIGASGTHLVCVCSIHQNAILLCSASGLKVTYKDLINMIVCNSQNNHCMIHHCHECLGKGNLKNYLVENMLGLEESDIEYSDTEINFSMWVGTDRANLSTESLQVDEFVDLLAATVDDMTAHSYISKAQSTYLMNQKENPDSDTCIMLDFAENYQHVLQDEI